MLFIIFIKFTYLKMLLVYGSIIILKIELIIAFKIWIGNSIQSLNFGSLIQSCQIGVLVQSIHSCGTLGYQASYNTRLQVKIYSIKEVKLYEESQSSIINSDQPLFIY